MARGACSGQGPQIRPKGPRALATEASMPATTNQPPTRFVCLHVAAVLLFRSSCMRVLLCSVPCSRVPSLPRSRPPSLISLPM